MFPTDSRYAASVLVCLLRTVSPLPASMLLHDASQHRRVRSCVASCIMMLASLIMNMQRTTVMASAESLRTLQAEAERRSVSLATVLREAVEEKASALRASRKPRVGIGRSTDGLSAADITSEPVARDPD